MGKRVWVMALDSKNPFQGKNNPAWGDMGCQKKNHPRSAIGFGRTGSLSVLAAKNLLQQFIRDQLAVI